MKKKRLIIVGVLALVVIAVAIFTIPYLLRQSEWKQTVAALQSLPRDRVETAVQAFARDRKASSRVLPAAVPLSELIGGGYLRTQDIRGLEYRDATVSLAADETRPNMIWIRVRATEGSDIALMTDGSVIGLPK